MSFIEKFFHCVLYSECPLSEVPLYMLIPFFQLSLILLTLGAHAQRGLLYLVCVCVSVSILALQATTQLMSDTNSCSATSALEN